MDPSIEMIPVDALRPWAKNARTHSRKQVKQIAESIRTFGFTNPVLIDAENSILAGHGRVDAAKLIGMARVPCVRLEHMSPEQKRAYVLADNKLEWGRDRQSWSGDFTTHPGDGFYRNLLGVQAERVTSNTDVVLSQRLRLGRIQDTPRIDRLYFVELLRSRQADLPGTAGSVRSGGAPSTATALSANAHWVWRDLDSAILPTRGLSLALQTGAGQATQHGGPSGAFARLYGRLTGYLPLGERWYGTARVEAGQVLHGSGVQVPDALGFRAGGDDSVRGYGYRALAPTDAGGGTIDGGNHGHG